MGNKEKKTIKGKTYRIAMIILLLIAITSLFFIGKNLYKYYVGRNAYNQLEQFTDDLGRAEGVGDQMTLDVDFNALTKINPDIKAWLFSIGTPINYPVVQGADNDKYLNTMFNGEINQSGTLFIDYRTQDPFNCFNTIIYGHHMKDRSMFGSLPKYKDGGYIDIHHTMKVILPDCKYDLKIFGVVTIPGDSELYKRDFNSDSEKADYIAKIKELSVVSTDVKVTPEDRIVMLSTCAYDYDNARLVVYGKLVKEE